MKTIKTDYCEFIPDSFTGIAEYPDGAKFWYKEGNLHREDGPAREFSGGKKEWYKEGILHREDGPAVEFLDGYKEWYKEGNLHREDGPAIESPDGKKEWYKEGHRHREDGPAFDHPNGIKYWEKEGLYHRLDGPACEYPDGEKCWYIEGNSFYPEELSELIKTSFFLGKEKGQYNFEWLKFLTEEGIKKFPIMPGMKEYKDFKEVFKKLEIIENE
jgi:hypothetical protein